MTRGAQQFRARPPRGADAEGRASPRRTGRVTSRPALEASILPFGRSQTGWNGAAPIAASSERLRPFACVTCGAGRMPQSAPRFWTPAA